jgi:hypothetical protein
MSDMPTIIDQIRESRRVRILGEFSQDLLAPPKTEYGFGTFLSQKQTKTSKSSIDLRFLRWELMPSKNPFDLSFEEFQGLNLNESEELVKTVYELCKDLIRDAWASGYRQVVICDRKIIYKTLEDEPITVEKIKELAKKHNKACYVFSAPDIVEESIWTQVTGEDSYPTLKVYIGLEETSEKDIVKECKPILADLDTGNPNLKVFNANLLDQALTTFSPFELREGEHLGSSYTYYQKRTKICVEDIKGKTNSVICFVRIIRDWDRCALLQASPNRTGFVGRDLLRALRIRLKIDSLKSTTQVLDVS